MTRALPIQLPNTGLAIATRGLGKRYGKKIGLHNVSLQVPEGAVYVLVGANGAGKSTTFKILLDLVRADAGTAEVLGLNPRAHGSQVRANVGYVPELLDWGYGRMRVDQLLHYHAQYFPTWDHAYAARLTRAFHLPADQRMSALSKGQARRVHLTMALAHRPPVLVLDEPTDGLDPLIRDETIGILIDHMAESPTTMLISTHHVEEMDQLADHIGVLSDGELRAQLPVDELRDNLFKYRINAAEEWTSPPLLEGVVLRSAMQGREGQLTIWGRQSDITSGLSAAHATIRDIVPLSLREATISLLAANGGGQV